MSARFGTESLPISSAFPFPKPSALCYVNGSPLMRPIRARSARGLKSVATLNARWQNAPPANETGAGAHTRRARRYYVPGSDDVPDIVLAVVDLHQDPEVVRRAYRR